MSERRGASSLPVETAVSAGGIVYRHTDEGGVEVVVCGRTDDRVWGLPKGTPNEGETIEQTALREVSEETGLEVEIDRKVGTIEYWFVRPSSGGHYRGGVRYHKWVHHYLMRPIGGSTDQHDHEYDTVVWLPAEQALKRLSYGNEANILRKALEMLAGDQP